MPPGSREFVRLGRPRQQSSQVRRQTLMTRQRKRLSRRPCFAHVQDSACSWCRPEREQQMGSRRKRRRVQQRRMGASGIRAGTARQKQRPLAKLRLQDLAEPQVQLDRDRHESALNRRGGYSLDGRHGVTTASRVGNHPARMTITPVIEGLEHRPEARVLARRRRGERVETDFFTRCEIACAIVAERKVPIAQQVRHARFRMQCGRRRENGRRT
jgi:hypothetical protein